MLDLLSPEDRPLLQKSKSFGDLSGNTTGSASTPSLEAPYSSSRGLRDHLRRNSESSLSYADGSPRDLFSEPGRRQLERARCALVFSLALTGVGVVWMLLMLFALPELDTDEYIFSGAVVSFLFCSAILWSYSGCHRLQKYPNQLIVHKSGLDWLLAVAYMAQYLVTLPFLPASVQLPPATPAVTQALLLAAEFWSCAMSLDLYQSISNPFTSFSYNLKVYKLTSVVLGAASGVVFYELEVASGRCALDRSTRFYWYHNGDATLPLRDFVVKEWTYYYLWVVLFMLLSLGTLIHVNQRLRRGLEETFETRKKVLVHGLIASGTYVTWSTWVIVLFSVGSLVLPLHKLLAARHLSALLNLSAFTHGARGCVNLLVWALTNAADVGTVLFFHSRARSLSDDWLSENPDEGLKPQLNLALRKQVIQMATRGIVDAVEHYQLLHQSIRTTQSFHLDWDLRQRAKSSLSASLSSARRLGIEEMQFYDFQPRLFATVRSLVGLNEDDYVRSFRRTANERLSEGRSGAFVFNTINRKYLVKSMTEGERDFLISILPAYLQYLKWNPATLLPRFFGLHAMKMYGRTFYFVVMANIFPTREVIHRRYDVKGSWVDRNAPVCVLGDKYRCANCNRHFVFGDLEECPSVVGEHYPDITLRDNDLKKRIKLPRETSHALLKQIARDSDFLCGMGIMDYSLLIGMHYSQFRISRAERPEKGKPSLRKDVLREMADRVDIMSPSMANPSMRVSHNASPKLQWRTRHDSASSSSYSKTHGDSIALDDDDDGSGRFNAHCVSGPSGYYIGIIDVLQTWTFEKQMERMYKVHMLRKDPRGISAVNPKQYAKRFQMKMCQLFYQPGDDDTLGSS
ncbi:phosphatidylinositol-4-phosphate-5-kinase (Pi-PIPKD10) [Achlya hypogyna]|uniref:Phosphatidylinositol-4-phosphate-5-kinase (Pi-PIPKD10) n=1 Tax=Achlya hypogyna TaxID=1202772 RepID=A0A1V9Z6D4_ACHHY|nr:phosphatidylinositol-4-phosphate-5-kinase (Pi-PIPKD10) [Achlya hypogyna]